MTPSTAAIIDHEPVMIDDLSPEPTEDDERIYRQITNTELTDEQRESLSNPETVFPRQRSVLAVHWHPEHVPLEVIRARIDRMFPNHDDELVIPTQHNAPMCMGDYVGVEIDCYSENFNRKVQLLFHFAAARLEGGGDVFRAMAAHTQTYRASQLFEFMDAVLDERFEARVQEAAGQTGADENLIEFVRLHVGRLRALLDRFESQTPKEMIKNKLVRNYFDTLRERYDDRLINHAQLYLQVVKKLVKRDFGLQHFYETKEFIEEGRALGAGIVIPHPEQFWPVLLEELDVDGIEVWNPQSFEFTRFLIDVVNRLNRTQRRRERPLLITMGDDCHMGEKVKDPRHRDPVKAGREIGYQPAWEDLGIQKRLSAANVRRRRVIEDYKARLG
jgi:hypothetical protein